MRDKKAKPALPGMSQRGQGLVEYAFILVLVSLVLIVSLVASGRQILALYSNITGTLRSAGL